MGPTRISGIAALDEYRLETEFLERGVIHTSLRPEPTGQLDSTARVRERWSLGEPVGVGGFGVVLRQTDDKGNFRAVKRLSRGMLKRARVSFSQELLALIKLKDYPKSFVQLFGWYEDKHDMFLAMEYIQHGDLDQYLNNSPPAAKLQVQEITRQLLKGLDIMHNLDICHGNIKPSNILIAATSPIWVKIADPMAPEAHSRTTLRTDFGPATYLAPEVIGLLPRHRSRRGERPIGYTNAVDLWALGVVVHRILTNEIPFRGTFWDDSDSETGMVEGSGPWDYSLDLHLLAEYCQGRTEFPTETLLCSKVSRIAVEFVKKLLTPEPQHRMTAAEAMESQWLLEDTREGRLLQAQPYKLETVFDGNSIVHTTYKIDSGTGKRDIEVKQKWGWKMDIGQGTFGVVYLEEEETSRQERAVKMVTKKRNNVDYSREISLLAKLADHHDSFVQFLGWYENRHSIYIAMEYMKHGDLSQYIGNSNIKVDAKDITGQLLKGLATLHDQNICHRDLKPQNVLVARPEPIWVKITDFGISKDENESLLHSSCGTPGYLAPEIFVKKENCYTNAVDIWALGCLLYQLLTTELPFQRSPTDAALSENESGVLCQLPSRELDMELFIGFWNGRKGLPMGALRRSEVDGKAIVFLKSLLVANPNSRISAIDALNSPWICGEPDLNMSEKNVRMGGSKKPSIMESLQELYAGVRDMKKKRVVDPPRKESVRFPAGDMFWNSDLRQVKRSSIHVHKAPGNKEPTLVIDLIPSNGREYPKKRIIEDIWELVWKLVQITQSVDARTFGILPCVGILPSTGSAGTPSGINMIFQVPENLENPRSLRDVLLSSMEKTPSKHARVQLAKYLTRSVLFLNSINFVHKEIRPENIIIFDSYQPEKITSGNDPTITPFLVGFRGHKTYDRCIMPGKPTDHENIYRHPERQGVFLEEQYNMRHDIYSLGVCLLEIALWKSFVCYDENESARILPELLADDGATPQPISLGYPNAYNFKKTLIKIAEDAIPKTMGHRYAEVTVSCLRILGDDQSNDEDLEDEEDLFADEEITTESLYMNEVLKKFEGID